MSPFDQTRTIGIPKKLGWWLFCGWLIAMGAIPLLGIGSSALAMILHIVAIAAGVLLLIDR